MPELPWIFRARVLRVHHESMTADLSRLDTGGPLLRVPILCDITGSSGNVSLPSPERSENDFPTGERELLACVARVGYADFAVVRFYPPSRRQGMFKDGRTMHRLPNDAYLTSDKDGNVEFYHPSGIFIRLGSGGHEDLTGKDVDGEFAITRNTSSQPTLTVGGPNYTLTIPHDGTISLTGKSVDITAPTVTVTGDVTIRGGLTVSGAGGAPGTLDITADVNLTGKLTQTGDIDQTGNLATSGDVAGATLTMGGQALTTEAVGDYVRRPTG